jgi:predicted DNA-binding transcriptional regulator AlpA
MDTMEAEPLVQAKVICERFGIPRGSLYRLVRENIIPYHVEPPKPWQRKRPRNLLFRVSEVEAALAALRERS